MATTILLVEDEAHTRTIIETVLSANDYRVLATDLVQTGWHLFVIEKPDLAILDLTLPDGNGLELCQKIRGHKERGKTPVVILTSQAGFDAKLLGFKAGADQYLVKPVPSEELLLWVQALLRRLSYDTEPGDVLRAVDCAIDVASHRVTYQGLEVPYLTVKEFDLLYFLVKNRPKVLSRKVILKRLWKTIVIDHVVDTHLTNLRRKLPPGLAAKIQAVPGKGFRYLE